MTLRSAGASAARWWMAVVVSCANAPAATDLTTSPPAPPPTALAPPAPLGSAAVDGRSAGGDAAVTASEDGGDELFDHSSWLAARGVDTSDVVRFDDTPFSGSCRPTRIGAPLRDALLCIDGPPMEGSLPGGESVFPLVVAYPDQGKVKIALRVPMAAGPETREMAQAKDDPDHGNYVELVATVSSDGLHLDLHDQPGDHSCAERLRSYRNDNESDPRVKGILTPHIRMMELACRSRGEYRWRAGRFRKGA